MMDPAEAAQFVIEAGLPTADLPWNAQKPPVFWATVSAEMSAGAVAEGRDRLLEVLRKRRGQSSTPA